MKPTTSSIFDLSPAEKLQLVQDLWDDLAAIPEAVPFQEWQREELERRRARMQNHTAPGSAWDEVKSRIHRQHGR